MPARKIQDSLNCLDIASQATCKNHFSCTSTNLKIPLIDDSFIMGQLSAYEASRVIISQILNEFKIMHWNDLGDRPGCVGM